MKHPFVFRFLGLLTLASFFHACSDREQEQVGPGSPFWHYQGEIAIFHRIIKDLQALPAGRNLPLDLNNGQPRWESSLSLKMDSIPTMVIPVADEICVKSLGF